MCLYFVDEGCAQLRIGDQSFGGTVKYSPMNWFETPAVVKFEAGMVYQTYIWIVVVIHIYLPYVRIWLSLLDVGVQLISIDKSIKYTMGNKKYLWAIWLFKFGVSYLRVPKYICLTFALKAFDMRLSCWRYFMYFHLMDEKHNSELVKIVNFCFFSNLEACRGKKSSFCFSRWFIALWTFWL